ncbi:metallophosphoesterase [Cellulomonas soli]|uniref:Metallophosphoesterase n=1 Tax=Cellulomonas soli TaxID=931535 RepID=A0A512PEL0_9CELL|nr:metallophosphoesterase [Cellulomonas soli]NYI58925.1 metallophosphoesterase (TIGR03767 family) [Cellulomonas soli]GEP69582.1 metallophosphoesterase [Cellulomonas soli]
MSGSSTERGAAAAQTPGATTVERRLVRGEPGEGGWAPVVATHGDPYVGAPPHPQGRTLAAFAHLSDLHLCDAESPARQEHLDHHGDPGAPYAGRLGIIGTYRPQEILTVQVAARALHALHRVDRAPVTGRPLDAVLVTGDVTDNAQRNELTWYDALMSGWTVSPRSGDERRSSWVGALTAGHWSTHVWHPDGAPAGEPTDRPTALFGYPRVPGLVEAARADLVSPGSPLPWHTVHGNHDALLQGTVAPDEALRARATGAARVVDLAPGQTPLVVLEAVAPLGPARYTDTPDSPTVPVPADPDRVFVEDGEFTARLRDPRDDDPRAGAVVARHGDAWARDVGEVRVIALDTVNPHGGWQGSVDDAQLTWLDEQLTAARGRYVIVTSHHPSWTLTNLYAPDGAPARHGAEAVLALLLRHPGVVAWCAGHVHAHSALRHTAPGPRGERGEGLWEITTASLVDWPQQLRVLELVREPGGTIALVGTVVDHDAPTTWDLCALDDTAQLGAISRALAVNDYRARRDPVRPALAAGRDGDRNAVWRLPDPHR